MKSLQLFWTQYADFSRRSDRKEFWISQAWHLLFTSPFWIYQLVLLFSNSKSEEEVIPLTGMDVSAWFSIFFSPLSLSYFCSPASSSRSAFERCRSSLVFDFPISRPYLALPFISYFHFSSLSSCRLAMLGLSFGPSKC